MHHSSKTGARIASKVIEAGLEIGENLAEGLGGLFKLGTGYGYAQYKNELRALCHFIFERGSRHGLAPHRSPYCVVKHLAVKTPTVIFTKEVAVPNTLIHCMKFG